MIITFNNKEVELTDYEYARDPVDCFVTGAYYTEDLQDLHDLDLLELNELQEVQEWLREKWEEDWVDRVFVDRD